MSLKKPKLTPDKALERLMDLCSRAEKSPFEIETKLKLWGLEKDIPIILDKLERENFVNPARFASSYSRDKVNFGKWGKIKIRYYLKAQGIEEALIEDALVQLDPDEYKKMILNELTKKAGSLKAGTPFEKKARLYTFGNQRGYEPEIMNQCFQDLGL
ncbi:MAG: RecX family transcriptional regulator [Bacteroidales bacterium]|nr:RecX family transcriptional regulator [Bacteroidales bacterium]